MTTQMVDKSNFDNKQYKADLQCAYDCGFVKGAIDELEKMKAKIEQMDFDLGDYYDHTDTIIEMVSKVIDNRIAELKGK